MEAGGHFPNQQFSSISFMDCAAMKKWARELEGGLKNSRILFLFQKFLDFFLCVFSIVVTTLTL